MFVQIHAKKKQRILTYTDMYLCEQYSELILTQLCKTKDMQM